VSATLPLLWSVNHGPAFRGDVVRMHPAEASFAAGLNRDVVEQAGVDERIERRSTQDGRP